jgi:hypothetical protein
MRWKWIFVVPAALLGMALLVIVGGQVVRLLWNWLLPPLFGWPQITFWQALALLVLCRILVGGFGCHRGSRPRSDLRQRMADRMADRIADRWEHMTPEERERFRQRLRERCGFDLGVPPASGPA